jgi:hypothetical protein
VIWFFERENSRLHYEIRREVEGDGYELVITHPDGRQDIEQYADSLVLLERSLHLQHALREAGWHRPPVRARMPV